MSKFLVKAAQACALSLLALPALAAPTVIGFDDLPSSYVFDMDTGQLSCSGDTLSNQYASSGVTFSNVCVSDAANELSIPPVSPNNVIAQIETLSATIFFTNPVQSVLLYSTHLDTITMTAYFGADEVGLIMGIGDNSAVDQNEPLQIDSPFISRVVLTSNAGFTFDDLTFDTSAVAPIPEPGLAWPLVVSGAILYFRARGRKH